MTFALASAISAVIVGIAVLLANSQRLANQAFALVAFIAALWLSLVYVQFTSVDDLIWVRANGIVASFLPWSLWLLTEAIATPQARKLSVLRRSLPWFFVGIIIIPLCLANTYVIARPSAEISTRGLAYGIYGAVNAVVYSWVVLHAIGEMRRLSGIRQIEIRFLVLNLGIGAFLCLAFVLIGNLLHSHITKQTGVILLGGSYVITGWGIASHRIFDVRQVLTSIAQRVGVVILLASGIFASLRLFEGRLPLPVGILLSAAIWGIVVVWFDRRSRNWLGLDGEQNLAGMRRQVIEIARTEPHAEKLVVRFEALLREHCQTRVAALWPERGHAYGSGDIELAKNHPAYAGLINVGWATPETLQRRRATPALHDLALFLEQRSLGLVVAIPRGSPTPSMLVTLGTKTHSWPFTYPEIQRIQNIAELMDNILTHSRLTNQAVLQAKMEHLAMMSRGLAHDLKNLITPVSSFLVHTDGRYAANSAEAEVHDAAKNSVRIMTDYVQETLFFSERLSPKFEPVDLRETFRAVREIMAVRIGRRNVALITTSSLDHPITADAVMLQRMLANLVANAVDASSPNTTVTLSANPGQSGWARIQVNDNGCGIAPEHLNRIFDPYFTTKEFGEEVRGFGLGLTICQKIVELHHGTIAVTSEVGQGTTVTVELPLAETAQRAGTTGHSSPGRTLVPRARLLAEAGHRAST